MCQTKLACSDAQAPAALTGQVSSAAESGMEGVVVSAKMQKTIVVETGINVQAPLFIKTGEKIKVDTRTGKYMERA